MGKIKYKTEEERQEAMRLSRLAYYHRNKDKINNAHKREYNTNYRRKLSLLKDCIEKMIADGVITDKIKKKYNFPDGILQIYKK